MKTVRYINCPDPNYYEHRWHGYRVEIHRNEGDGLCRVRLPDGSTVTVFEEILSVRKVD